MGKKGIETPYVVECQACNKSFRSSDQKTKFHVACVPESYKPIKRLKTSEFNVIRNFIYLRDGFTCQLCCLDLRNDDFHRHAHHIDHNPNNNSTDNLITLCNKCHIKVHSRGISFVVDKIDIKDVVLGNGLGATGKNQFKGV